MGAGPLDARSDVYSLGCVLYEMLAGEPPFTGATAESVVHQHLTEEPAAVTAKRPAVPADVAQTIRRALAKSAADRFTTAAQFGAALAQAGPQAGRAGPPRPPTAGRRGRWALAALGLAGLIALVVILNPGRVRERLGGQAPAIQSLAVLPLENLSRDPEQEYFADGMTEELTAMLSQIGSLKVVSRTSAMRFKGARRSVREIGRALQVDAVVEGSVRRAGDQVRITAQLVRAATDQHLWAATYDRPLRDVLGLQSEVARAIAAEVRATVTPQEHTRLASTRPVDPAAYEAYLRGRYHWNQRSTEGIRQAIAHFQRAIAIEPTWAQAYAGLADCYLVWPGYGAETYQEALPKAKAAALRALALDSLLAEAHVSLAMALSTARDWSGAGREFRRAIELNPNYATARHWYAIHLGDVGQKAEAHAQVLRARELDPLSMVIQVNVAYGYEWDRQWDRAAVEMRKAAELGPTSPWPHFSLSTYHYHLGNLGAAKDELERAGVLWGDTATARLVRGASVPRDAEEYLRLGLEGSRRRWEQGLAKSVELARWYGALGENDRAFEWLERSLQDYSMDPRWLRYAADLEGLRRDPRYAALMRRIGLEP